MYRRFNDTKRFLKKWSAPLTLNSAGGAVTPRRTGAGADLIFVDAPELPISENISCSKATLLLWLVMVEIEVRTATNLFDENGGSWGIHERVAIPIRALDQIERERAERRLAELAKDEARELAVRVEPEGPLDRKSSLDSTGGWADSLAEHGGPTLKILDRDALESWLSTSRKPVPG